MKNYVAVIGDIVNSKNINDRREVQNQLKEILNQINMKYSDSISACFMITLGDEFQGLIHRKASVMNIINEIELYMHPIQIRFGIGIGEVTTDIHLYKSNEIDGPAYHRARKMIVELKEKSMKNEEIYSTIMIDSGIENITKDRLMNTIFSLSSILKSKWTTRQVEMISCYRKNGENQYKTAEVLNIGQPTVSKMLKTTHYYSVKSANKTIECIMEENNDE